ncbi:MAG: hypothetical protein CBE33_01310 [Candidatus Pelagibacter sp. TMED273]|nr:MAG: hypothetical protein CBE33_01310 [Candidatus Pelagibacter sp. TMED273]|tara:strand:+ start:25790 stop:26917 length:1128 start_codon:yes stop_codon:yes gene_type:complete
MKVILFFTYGISLNDWKESGLLNREIQLYKQLHEKYNIEFTFLTYGDSQDLDIINLPFIKIFPIYKYLKKSKNKYINILKSTTIPFKISKELKEFDIFKTNQLLGSWVAIISKIIFKKPLMIRTGYDLISFSKRDNKNKLKQYLYYSLTKNALKYSDLYLVSSNVDKRYLSKIFFEYQNKIKLRPNWISISSSKNFKDRYDKKLISVGRLENQKNFSELIKIFSNTDFEIEIYGSGTKKSELIDNAKKYNTNLKIFEPVSNEILVNNLSNYKLYISSSNYEGNPKSVLEAMSMGCIVIAKKNKNMEEIIQNNKNGFLYETHDQLIDYVELIINNEKLWKEISKSAIDAVVENNSLSKLSDNEYKDYKNLMFSDKS